MSTQPQPATKFAPTEARRTDEVTAPEMFQFRNPGEQVAGFLLKADQVVVRGKLATEYTFQHDSGVRFTILGTYDLDKKISADAHLQRYLIITYLGEDHQVQTQGSPLRRFKVEVERSRRGEPKTDAGPDPGI